MKTVCIAVDESELNLLGIIHNCQHFSNHTNFCSEPSLRKCMTDVKTSTLAYHFCALDNICCCEFHFILQVL